MRLRLRTLLLGAFAAGGGYWLWRYLQPERSTLVLNDSVVIITGASSGIGRAYAQGFARRGAKVVLAARRAEVLEEVRSEIEPYAADVLVVPTDVRKDSQLRALVSKTLKKFGRIDIVVNNAGLAMHGPLQGEPLDQIRALVDTNLSSAMALTALCLPTMLSQRSGWIVNISSMAGLMEMPFHVVYGPVKRGLISFSDTLRRQLDGTGIEVVSVLPTYTDTELVTSETRQWLHKTGFSIDTPQYVVERTLDGMLKHRHNVLFGGQVTAISLWFHRHFPRLGDLGVRAFMTPEVMALNDDTLPEVEGENA